MAEQTVPGLIEPGNLDPYNRPVLHNPDGSVSTTKSFSVEMDGKEVLLPSIINGKEVDQATAIEHYKKTGEHLGKFTTPAAADAYSESLHNEQAKRMGLGGQPSEVVAPSMELTAPAPTENPFKAGEPSPFTLGVDTTLTGVEDLWAAPPAYWQALGQQYDQGQVTPDQYYQEHRQEVHDYEEPLLRDLRAQQAAAAPPATPAQPEAPPQEAAPPAPEASTAAQATNWLSTIGVRGVQPLAPAQGLVDAFYSQDAARDQNPVYVTLSRLATALDTALTVANIPVTGVGDLAALVFAPLTLGLKAAGADKATVEGFIQNARLLPELAAAFGTGGGILGKLGKTGRMEGLAGELTRLLPETKVAKGGKPTPVYHGTAAGFQQFDLKQADPRALYGSGLYFTENPTVASGYAEKGAGHKLVPAPNVRPAYLDMRNPFDVDAPLPQAEVERIGQIAEAQFGAMATVRLLPERQDGGSFYRQLQKSLRFEGPPSKDLANQVLQAAGYDGITHIGGAITGGEPHRVWIAFSPEQVVSPFEYHAQLAGPVEQAGRLSKLEAAFSDTMASVWGSERGEFSLGPDLPKAMVKKYEAAVIAARRGGPRSHAQVEAEAKALINAGLVSMDYIRTLVPGTVLSDERMYAVVKVLADEGERVKALAQKALETRNPVDLQAMLEQLYTLGEVDPKRIGATTESGRTQNILNDPTSGRNQFLMQFEQLFRSGATDPMTMAQAIAGFQDPGQLAVFARQATKPGFADAWKEYYVMSLFWGPKSWAANLLGNTVAQGYMVVERQVAGLIGAMPPVLGGSGGKGVQLGEAWEMVQGILGSQLDAIRLGVKAFTAQDAQFGTYLEAFRGGEPALSAGKLEHPRGLSKEAFNATGSAGAAIDFLGTVYRTPSGVLSGTDDYFKVTMFQGEARAVTLREARQEAMANGLEGKEFADYVQAAIARKMMDLPPSVVRKAHQMALYSTFNQELGTTGQLLQKWANTVIGKMLLPVMRTPTNVGKWVGERTPLMVLNTRFYRELTGADPAVADTAKARLGMGAAVLGIGALWWYNGTLTAQGPTDPALRKDLIDNRGWLPTAVRIGDQYASLSRMDNVGILLGMIGSYGEAVMNADTDGSNDTDLEEAANAIVVSTAHAVSDRTMLTNLSRAFSTIADPERAGKAFIANLITGVLPFSGMVRQAEPVLDPVMRDAKTVLDRVRANIPGLSDAVSQRISVRGDPVYATGVWGPVAISQSKDDPVAYERVKVGARIPAINDKIQGVTLSKSEKEYWAIQRGKMEHNGKTLQEAQADLIGSDAYRGWSKERKAAELERVLKAYTYWSQQKTVQHYQNLDDSIREKQRQNRDAMTKGPQPGDADLTPLLRSLGR